ncbi:protein DETOXIFICATION 16-like isoform X2 [Cannabis sativa]|uniref:protein DETOXIFICATION 16-like isoform X2 n=1 Tax=Cannabis sativa TaxID=3483 RepID=UPI0029C9C638|nr:protein DETOXIFICATION 16-like isoform X2 [Cannabis sativa]
MNNNNMEEEQRARLLPKPVSSSISEQVNTTHLRKDLNEDDHDIVSEVKQQLQLAGPLICVNVLTYCLQVISVMFVGHLGELSLAGASMATSFASVTGFSLLIGMGSALETFCGQSYGAKQYHMLGIHMQRGMIVLLVVSIPLAVIWFNAGQILLFLGQDPEISAEAGRYARFMIPSIFAYAVTQCHTKFLQTQNNVVPMMITAGITTLLHLFICWFMVFKSGLGNRGAAMANAISYWINALSLVLYVRISPLCKHTWTGFSMEAFHGIPKFLKLSIPSAVMLTLEIWSFEMMVLLSGFLPNPKLETSVLSISLNTCALVYMVPLGLSGVISTRISNELGAGRPQIARLALCVALCMVVAEGTLVGAVLILGRRIWGYCYSGEEEVVKYVGQMMILISISQFFDGIQSVLSGSVRGSGRQKIGAFANLAAYYLMGIPVALLLAFVFHIGGKGLWIGIIVALIMQALCLALITICTDWEKEVNQTFLKIKIPSLCETPSYYLRCSNTIFV